jgi:histidinol-phosphatase (PHP family)
VRGQTADGVRRPAQRVSLLSMVGDHHIHTGFCPHAVGEPRACVERGLALGLTELGFAEHLPFPPGWRPRHDVTDDWAMSWDQVDVYCSAVQDLAREYAADARIVLGIEVDYLDDAVEQTAEALAGYPFQYVIGSVHIVGDRFAFDHPDLRDELPAYGIDRLHLESLALAERAAASGLFDVIGHLDHAGKFGPPSDEAAVRAAASGALRAMTAAGMTLELNTAGWRKAGRPFPAPELLVEARELGLPLVFGSDAHRPEDVGADFGRAVEAARAAGYTETRSLCGAPPERLP